MKFNYQARKKNGEISVGQIEASSEMAAASLLKRNGLYVTFLEEAVVPIYAKEVKLFEKISNRDLVMFSRLLSIMFKSKIPLVESLQTLAFQSRNEDLKEKVLKIADMVEGGTSFSEALSRYPKVFSPFFISMVKSGEISGKLSDVLNYLAEHLEREYYISSKIKNAMIYPSLVVSVMVLVMGLMVYFVVPQMSSILLSSNQELPFFTKFVISVSEFLRKWALVLLGVSIPLFYFLYRVFISLNGREAFYRFFLNAPLVGPFLKMIYLTRFAENLSTLISGGLPVAQSLETVADIINQSSYKRMILKARDGVRKGMPISSVLAQDTDLFSPVFVQMVLVGEKTGTLGTTLLNIVDFYQQETDRMISSLLSILEPALIIVLGVVVGGAMISILMPLYNMMLI